MAVTAATSWLVMHAQGADEEAAHVLDVDELHGEERIEVRVGERGAAETKALQTRRFKVGVELRLCGTDRFRIDALAADRSQ